MGTGRLAWRVAPGNGWGFATSLTGRKLGKALVVAVGGLALVGPRPVDGATARRVCSHPRCGEVLAGGLAANALKVPFGTGAMSRWCPSGR